MNSYIGVVIDVHVGRASKLIILVLESRILVRQLDPFFSQGLTHGLVLLQRDPEEREGKIDKEFDFRRVSVTLAANLQKYYLALRYKIYIIIT